MIRNWLATALYRAHDRLKWLAEWCWDAAVYTAHRDSWSSIRARRRYAKRQPEQPVGGNPLGWGRGPGGR